MRVLITQAREGADRVAARLRALGHEPVLCPLVRIEPLPGERIDVGGYDWIVLTSARGAELLLDRAGRPLPKCAVIGPGTAEALRARGIEPALVASTSSQEGLLAELPRPAGRVLFAGAEGARGLLPRELDADVVTLYRTVEQRPDTVPVADVAVIASASAARSLGGLGADLPCVSIGPLTTAEARAAGLRVVVEAATHDLDGLVEAVRLAASRLDHPPQRSSPSSATMD
jgi:uroporphyrinogen-III synthase